MQRKLQDTETKCRVLQIRLHKTLHRNEEFLQEKERKELKPKEIDCKHQNIEKHNKG